MIGPFLSNQFLLAMPVLDDPFFARSVVYICEHTSRGATGIIVNRPLAMDLSQLLKKEDTLETNLDANPIPVLCGGPVQPKQGFVIHKPGGEWQSSLQISDEICITISQDILKAIAQKQGPSNAFLSLGYANWQKGQLEEEILNNFWLTAPANQAILFDVPFSERWNLAMRQLGVDITKLVYGSGYA